MSKSTRFGEWWLIAELVAAAFLILALIAPEGARNYFLSAMGMFAVGGVILVFLQGPGQVE